MSPAPDRSFVSLLPQRSVASHADLWRRARRGAASPSAAPPQPGPSPMESNVSVIGTLAEAPPRTSHSEAIVRSSPLPPAVRALIERREFGRPFDAAPMDLDAIAAELPALACPEGDVVFPASDDGDLESLSYSVDGLLRHRKRLLSPSVDPSRPRKRVLILGAGPAGLMAAVQLRLRGHDVVVCEQREVYGRNRYIGVYKEVTHLMASLGMPERMTYDFSQYRGKRGIMLADIQTFLHGVALKLGAVIYMGAVPRRLSAAALQTGELELQRATHGTSMSSVGMLRWHHDGIARVRSGATVRFDTIVEATGGRSGLRETLVGKDNVVFLRTLGRAAVGQDPSLDSFFADPEDHSAEYVESGYGCPPGLRQAFAEAILSDSQEKIPDALPCFVSNIDASIFTRPMRPTEESLGLASRIGDRDLEIPHDWVVLECRLADQSLSRYHIEGPLPQTFEFGGKRLATREVLDRLNPVSLLIRILYAMGVPFDAVDRRRLVDFYNDESSRADASDIVSMWVGGFRGLRLGGERPIWTGTVPGNTAIGYAIIGEALQNAWYRFGVGVDDAFAAAVRLAEGLELDDEARLSEARRFERVMIARSVQILYHLFAVARNTDQGVVGPVLTEYYMEERHGTDVAEARLREASAQGAEMLAAAFDIWTDDPDSLVDAALDHARDKCCRHAIELLEAFGYPAELFARATLPMRVGDPDWRAKAHEIIEPALTAEHSELVSPLFSSPATLLHGHVLSERPRTERLVELAAGRYAWMSPWLRACALRALDLAAPGAQAALERAASDADPLVAETAAARSEAGDAASATPRTILDKVLVLREVNLFRAVPHETLAGLAALLTPRWAQAGERVVDKGDLGDCLYVIASGRVRVHDGERTFQQLGRHQVFGELSLLDARPRAASVTAMEDTFLLRLGQGDFYALLREQPEVTQAINRALCDMVRAANASSSELDHARPDARRVAAQVE